MLYPHTLSEISHNINTGVEYEIALFYQLVNDCEKKEILRAVNNRADKDKIMGIIDMTSINPILIELNKHGLELFDASFETQNDDVGPSDIVMFVRNKDTQESRIGISVKYANTCTLNVTGRKFITESQIKSLRNLLPDYTLRYINEMESNYGSVENWFRQRKPSDTTDEFIDLIRDAVIENWENVTDKVSLLSNLFHSNSPIPFWVVTYKNNGYELKTNPQTIEMSRADDVVVKKYQTSYVAFYLDNKMVGHMQVKFNNGFVEKCKKIKSDVEVEGIRMSYGQPFSSWNFSVESK